jgi:hypothetical protein
MANIVGSGGKRRSTGKTPSGGPMNGGKRGMLKNPNVHRPQQNDGSEQSLNHHPVSRPYGGEANAPSVKIAKG